MRRLFVVGILITTAAGAAQAADAPTLCPVLLQSTAHQRKAEIFRIVKTALTPPAGTAPLPAGKRAAIRDCTFFAVSAAVMDATNACLAGEAPDETFADAVNEALAQCIESVSVNGKPAQVGFGAFLDAATATRVE